MDIQQVRKLLSFVHATAAREDRSPQDCLKVIRTHPLLNRIIQEDEPVEPNAGLIVSKLFDSLKEHPLFGDRYRHLTPQVRAQLLQSWTQIVAQNA